VFAQRILATAAGDPFFPELCEKRLRELSWIIRRRRPRVDGDAIAVFLQLVRAYEAGELSSIAACQQQLWELGWDVHRFRTGRRGRRAS
jgi:hypothetical protein